MPRPRIEGFDEKVIQGFIDRGIYRSQKEVLSAAIRHLAQHHMALSAKNDIQFSDETYLTQLNLIEKRSQSLFRLIASAIKRSKKPTF